MTNIFTNRDFFSALLTGAMPVHTSEDGVITMTNADIQAWAKHNIEMLDNRAQKRAENPRKRPLKYDAVSLDDKIMSVLSGSSQPLSASEIINADASYDWGSVQRVSTRLRGLAENNAVTRIEGKKKDPVRYQANEPVDVE